MTALHFKPKMTPTSVKIKSFTREAWYAVNTELPYCTCPKFERSQTCKHLDALGLWTVKPYVSKVKPTFSQALCALVKAIRIRQLDETVYWLVYLNAPKHFMSENAKSMRFRVARRLLIAGPEDGQSVAVMEKCAENFWSKLTKPETELVYLVAEAVRVCKLPNWWQDPGGRQYVYQSMVGCNQRMYVKKPTQLEPLLQDLLDAIVLENTQTALGIVSSLNALPKLEFGATKQAEWVLDVAKKSDHQLAQRLCKLHLRNKSALSGDNNFIAQAVWMLCGGKTDLAEALEPVTAGECYELIAKAEEAWKTPHPCPTWALDGIHCAGNDRRFMGMLVHMNAVSNAFTHYGRVDPNDAWLPEFLSWDGLQVEKV